MGKYKDYKETITGSTFPGDPYREVNIKFTRAIIDEYIPEIEKMEISRGMKLLCIIMAHKEGFTKGSRSYRTNNPGNIGNDDTGQNQTFETLAEGIGAQVKYIQKIIDGKHKAFPIGKEIHLKPYFSKEIHDNQANYKMSGYLPGYKFKFTGQIDQFVKIYATAPRGGNGYINMIVSFFENHGIKITPETTLQEIVNIK